ncbi:MAG: Type IV pilus biogenesis [Rhodobacteraceae bacterium HLUCCA12]|nr:MAG: Type IV pilus biogenesis [Rhodobacteraceae bacterium HLUCCA12]
MKPNFALKLSHDGVQILRRTASGWVQTGSARFDSPDLETTLHALRAEAEAQAPDGVYSKLLMPESEVRFATVSAPGPTDEARKLQIEAEIDGLTPYALDELTYDYVIDGDHALVALCAREIMAEAEEFAQTHGFNPVSFAATAPPGAFDGEPFLGETTGARAFLPKGARIERDAQPTVAQPAATPKAPAPASTPAKAPGPAPQGKAKSDDRPVAAPPDAPTAPPAPAAKASVTSVAAAAPEAFSRVGNLVRRMGTRVRRERVEAERKSTPPAASAQKTAPDSAATPRAAAPGADRQASAAKPQASKSPPAQAASSVGKASPRPAAPDLESRAKGPDRASPPGPAKGAAPLAFSSRRKPTPTDAPKGPSLAAQGPGAQADKSPGPGGRIAVTRQGDPTTPPTTMTRLYRRSKRAARGALSRIGLATAPRKARKAERARSGGSASDSGLKPVVPGSTPPSDERAKASEAEALTIFGARSAQRSERSFARRGLMLTGGLLLLLVAVAIWALYFTTSPGRDDPEVALLPQEQTDDDTQDTADDLPQIQAPARIADSDEPEGAEPAPDDDAVTTDPAAEAAESDPAPDAPADETADETTEPADAEATTADPVGTEPEETAEAAPDTTDPEALLEQLVEEALTEAMPSDVIDENTAPATEGTGTDEGTQPATSDDPAPDLAQSEDELDADAEDERAMEARDSLRITPDSDAESDQRLALPQLLDRPRMDEVAPRSPPPPPPYGVEFDLGEDGRVEATAEGALTPSGVTVYAGTPDAVPPARPAELAPEPEPEPAEPEDDGAANEPDDTPRQDPALAGFRPQPRSPRIEEMAAERAAAEAEAEAETEAESEPDATNNDDDNAALDPPPGGVSLADLRPQRRPTDMVPPTRSDTATIDDDAAAEAVAVSLRPSSRPAGLSARAQEILAAMSTRQQTEEPAPAPAEAAPRIPTSASVAEQATQARAINLRRLNLVGVFGTPDSRRALVRLSNGQVVRVRVGDTLDGGQVAAIGDNELRYVKNGRNEVLRVGTSG